MKRLSIVLIVLLGCSSPRTIHRPDLHTEPDLVQTIDSAFQDDGNVDQPPPIDLSVVPVDLTSAPDLTTIPDLTSSPPDLVPPAQCPTLGESCNGSCCAPYTCHTFGCIPVDAGFYCPSVCVGLSGTACANGFECYSAFCYMGSCQ